MTRIEDDSTLEEIDIEEEVEDYHDTPGSSKKAAPTAPARKILNLDEHQVPMAGILFSAIIFLIAIMSKEGPDKYGYLVYGIFLSMVAMVLSSLALGFTYKPELVQDNPSGPKRMNQFLFAWNFIGACVMTFGSGPFVVTSNGYFAVWGMSIFALYGIGVSFDTFKTAGSMMGHMAASAVVIIALASDIESLESFKGESIFGIILACLSTALVAFQVRSEGRGKEGLDKKILCPVTVVFAIMWIVAASIMTFRGPFILTSNGYFASWGGAVTALFIAIATKPGDML